jgi:hypothetical protein
MKQLVEQEKRHPFYKRQWAKGKVTGLRTALIYIRAALEAGE